MVGGGQGRGWGLSWRMGAAMQVRAKSQGTRQKRGRQEELRRGWEQRAEIGALNSDKRMKKQDVHID